MRLPASAADSARRYRSPSRRLTGTGGSPGSTTTRRPTQSGASPSITASPSMSVTDVNGSPSNVIRKVRALIPPVLVGLVWAAVIVRARRRDASWSPRQDLVILGLSAAVTVFISLPIAPGHAEPARPLGVQIAMWVTFWLLSGLVVRALVLLGTRLRRAGRV